MSERISNLFVDEPRQWGLRGDPFLWREMRERLASADPPDTPEQLRVVIETTFEELTGYPVSHAGHIHVERYRSHGMSSGMVDPRFWRETAIPLLQRRFAEGRRVGRLRLGNALILIGATGPCVAAALASEAVVAALNRRGAAVPAVPILAAAIVTILLGFVLTAPALRAGRGARSSRSLFPLLVGPVALVMYAVILARILAR